MYSFLSYLRYPVPSPNQRPKFIEFFGLFALYVLIIIPLSVVIFFVSKEFHIKSELKFSFNYKLVLTAVLLAPFYEEVFFRSWLKLKKNIVMLLITILPLLAFKAIYDDKLTSAVVLVLLLLVFLILLRSIGRKKIEDYISNHFIYFFYASVLIFGLLHAANFEGNTYLILALSPILGSPQIVLGFFLGFVRMKYGLAYSILFHVSVNALFLFISLKPAVIFSLF